jgi:hypothetical protein
MENLEVWCAVYGSIGVCMGVWGCYSVEKDRSKQGLDTGLLEMTLLYFTIGFLWFPLVISEVCGIVWAGIRFLYYKWRLNYEINRRCEA